MSKHNVVGMSGRDTHRDELTEMIRDGARKLMSGALEAEVEARGLSVSTVSRRK